MLISSSSNPKFPVVLLSSGKFTREALPNWSFFLRFLVSMVAGDAAGMILSALANGSPSVESLCSVAVNEPLRDRRSSVSEVGLWASVFELSENPASERRLNGVLEIRLASSNRGGASWSQRCFSLAQTERRGHLRREVMTQVSWG